MHIEKKNLWIKAMRDSKLAITTWERILESFWTVLGKHWLSTQQENWMIVIIRKGGEQSLKYYFADV